MDSKEHPTMHTRYERSLTICTLAQSTQYLIRDHSECTIFFLHSFMNFINETSEPDIPRREQTRIRNILWNSDAMQLRDTF